MLIRIIAAFSVSLGVLVLAADALAEPIDLKASSRVQQQFDSAIAELAKGNLKQADATLQELLKEDPTHLYALLARAQIAINEGRIAAADRGVASVLEREQQLPEGHNMRGVVLLLQKRNEDAAKEFRRALELRPNYVTPRFYLAAIARSKGDHSEAAREYKALADAAPGIPAGYLGPGRSAHDASQPVGGVSRASGVEGGASKRQPAVSRDSKRLHRAKRAGESHSGASGGGHKVSVRYVPV